ncbi:EAL domain-containing protein [Oxalobacteraceae bacterium R-40]|uniref:EAL domain-containing protein n=1 Tax=Keguizhuia sedimenti TaxID=3064264 RepID=A0ABU1BKD9_9BURK|nr:EAL domain-containing protein [Oxalobacteraceae bacterium R-40]
MTTTAAPDQLAPFVPRIKEFFLARQPILNRHQGITAYELLFRRATTGAADVADNMSATASVIVHASELGLENVVGGTLAFVNVDDVMLMSDIVRFLPHDKIVLEILESVELTDALISRVAELAGAGYKFALDDVVADSAELQKILPLVTIIKVEITNLTRDELQDLANRFRPAKVFLLAEKVETLEQFRDCLEAGFDYFQGYYFAKPVVLSGKKLDPSQMAVMQLLTLIVADADTSEIERAIKQDASLGLTLLKLVNTPAFGAGKRVDSLSQALMMLGRRQLQYWLQILLYAEPHKGANFVSPLLVLATTRGKLMELIAAKLRPGNASLANVAFTVGIMSLMDTLFGQPMDKILERFAVGEEVKDALLYHRGFYGDLLTLAGYIERIEEHGEELVPLLENLHFPVEDLHKLQVEALEWSDRISRSIA